jgi:hypothetical protein
LDYGPDLKKHRRFALVVGLVTIFSWLAGLNLKGDASVSGFLFTIGNPKILGPVLLAASSYALVSFWFYGGMLTRSPGKARDAVRRLVEEKAEEGSFASEESRERRLAELRSCFPVVRGRKFELRARTLASMNPKPTPTSPSAHEPGPPFGLLFESKNEPRLVKIACAFQTVDYWAPVWVNAIALLSPVWGPWAAPAAHPSGRARQFHSRPGWSRRLGCGARAPSWRHLSDARATQPQSTSPVSDWVPPLRFGWRHAWFWGLRRG